MNTEVLNKRKYCFLNFSIEPKIDGVCDRDSVKIYSANRIMQPVKLITTICGLQGIQTMTFTSNIIIEFSSDDEEQFTGFFAELFTMGKLTCFLRSQSLKRLPCELRVVSRQKVICRDSRWSEARL